VEFSNGLETLFNKQKNHEIEFKEETNPTISDLVVYVKKHLLLGKEELFSQGSSVRPGIIVLVNDTDWELLGQNEYQLQENDSISFISTLHGG